MVRTVKDYEKLSEQYNKILEERNSLIDDLPWYKVKVSRLERENERLRKANSSGWKQKDEVINKLISNIKSKDNLLSKISQHIGNKPSSSTYKYFREKLDFLGIKEGE